MDNMAHKFKLSGKSAFLIFMIFLSFNSICLGAPAPSKTVSRPPLDNELDNIKQVLENTVTAINQKDTKKLIQYFSKDFTLITLENKKITPLQSFLDYWDILFKGNQATLKNLIINIQIDPEAIYLDKKIAILQGAANEKFVYFKGDEQILYTRWTAVLEKNAQSKNEWKISAIHHSSGITKSMLTDLQSQMLKTALGGLVVGLVLGMLFISLSRKTRH
jgi:ketosteroid isomerase-like protein